MKLRLPVCLHIREADEDGFAVLASAELPHDWKIHLHCFNGRWSLAQKWLETYPNLKVGLIFSIYFQRSYVSKKHALTVLCERKVHFSTVLCDKIQSFNGFLLQNSIFFQRFLCNKSPIFNGFM